MLRISNVLGLIGNRNTLLELRGYVYEKLGDEIDKLHANRLHTKTSSKYVQMHRPRSCGTNAETSPPISQ